MEGDLGTTQTLKHLEALVWWQLRLAGKKKEKSYHVKSLCCKIIVSTCYYFLIKARGMLGLFLNVQIFFALFPDLT